MISLAIFILVVVLSLILAAWMLSLAARAVGSSRGRFRNGLVVVLLLLLVNIFFLVIAGALARMQARPSLAIALVFPIVELAVIFVLLRRGFRLTSGRTFAPFGAYIALTLLQIGLAVLVLKPYLVEAFVFPTKGMSPTIEPGDRFVVNKIIRPRRMDLVAYWSQGDRRAVYLKRLIGLPGERLRFEGGGLYVNDQPTELPKVLAGRCHAGVGTPAYWRYQDGQTITLGNDEYFFVGDNADISLDSRFTGPSHASSLVGVADLIYWPVGRFRVVR